MVIIDFKKSVADVKAQIRGIGNERRKAEKVLGVMRANRDRQKAIDYPRFEKMFARGVRDFEKLVASQEAMAVAGGEVVAALAAAGKAWKKYLDAAGKAKKNTEKSRATVERIVKAGEM